MFKKIKQFILSKLVKADKAQGCRYIMCDNAIYAIKQDDNCVYIRKM